MIGTKLAHYQITSHLGTGGMGEVYQATDSKLDRSVAVKLLPAAFASDAERLSRFRREAQLLASLNHPNIAHIYGLEEAGEMRCIVMELVEGETLQARLKRSAIPVEEALLIGKQIAEALEAAHEKGVIHRDLKPGNVMLTRDGTVKVLDFGLAKAYETNPSDSSLSNSPTMTNIAATNAGIILGTAAYMSPEQASGKPVDKRADIWSFGVVLWEMLTGNSLFASETVSHTMADVLRAPIDFDSLPAATPLAIRDLLRRCLNRDARKRMRDIGEARIAIEEASKPGRHESEAHSAPQKRSIVPWAVASVLAMVLGISLWTLWSSEKTVDRPLVRLDVDLGSDVSLGSTAGTDAIISPNGTRLVYVSQGKLFTRRLDQLKDTELQGTVGAQAPFFSPDGQWVAYFGGGKLRKISMEGGAAVTLCDSPQGRGGTWGDDGNIIAALNSAGGALFRIPSGGGTPIAISQLAQGEITHRWPQILPGGKAVLFTVNASTTGYDAANIEVMSLADGHRKILIRGGTFGRYVASSDRTGHLIYVNHGTLFAVAFDPKSLELRGASSPVLEHVTYNTGQGDAQVDVSRNGTLLYRSGGGGGGLVSVQWLDSAGRLQPLLAKPGAYLRPSLSPDGQKLALTAVEDSADLWVYEWQRDNMTRLTFGGGASDYPLWSPDGRYITFQSPGGMSWIRADGAGKPQAMDQSRNVQYPWSFSHDGKRLAYMEVSPETGFDILTVPVDNTSTGLKAGMPEPFLHTPSDERYPMFSPDGNWLAYASSESGIFQVYVRAFPDNGGKRQISNNGGVYPLWSPNGHELFFESLDNHVLMSTYTVKGDSFAADKPQVWSDKRLGGLAGSVRGYDLAPDGKRIAALLPVDTPEAQKAQNHVTFLENFFDELRRRAPAGQVQ